MDSMNLKDFRPDDADSLDRDQTIGNTDTQIPGSSYQEEINTLKIDKLSNRVTIISIIIPCLITAITIFAYLDMKERVVDVDLTKQSQVDKISQQLEEKLNALDLKIAKNTHTLENTLPQLENKNIAFEGQIAKLVSGKADSKSIESQMSKIESQVLKNSKQDKATIASIGKIKKENLSAIKKNQVLFNKNTKLIKEEITLFKEEFDARLLELSDYEQQIGELRRDLSLLDKKFKHLDEESVSKKTLDELITQLKTELNNQITKLENQVKTLNRQLNTNITRLQNDIDRISKSLSSGTQVKQKSAGSKPKPQIKIDSSDPVTIEEESLIQ